MLDQQSAYDEDDFLLEDGSLDGSMALMDNLAKVYQSQLDEGACLYDDFQRLKQYLQQTGALTGVLKDLLANVQRHVNADKLNIGVQCDLAMVQQNELSDQDSSEVSSE